MPTYEELKQQVTQARQQLSQAKEQAISYRPQFTRQQLYSPRVQRREAVKDVEAQRKKVLGQIAIGEAELIPAEQELQAYETAQAEYAAQQKKIEDLNFAKQIALENPEFIPLLESREQREYAQSIIDDKNYYENQMNELKELGIKPIFSNGQIAGFEDSKIGMSYSLDNLPRILEKYRQLDIPSFERIGLVTTIQQPSVPQPIIPTSDNLSINLPTSKLEYFKMAVPIRSSSFLGVTSNILQAPERVIDYSVSRWIGSPIYKTEMKQKKPYQPEAQAALGELAAKTAIYVTPVGIPIMLFGGIGKAIEPKATTQQRILGIGEAGLGIFGLKSQVSGFKAAKAARELETAQTTISGVRIANDKTAFDILVGGKATRDNIFISTGILKSNIGKTQVNLMEGSRIFSFKIPKGKTTAEYSAGDIFARTQPLPSNPIISKDLLTSLRIDIPPMVRMKEFPSFKSTFGKVSVAERLRGQVIISDNPLFFPKKPLKEISRGYFAGAGKYDTKNKIQWFFGTTKPKISKSNILIPRIKGKINVKGGVRVFKIENKEPSSFFNSLEGKPIEEAQALIDIIGQRQTSKLYKKLEEASPESKLMFASAAEQQMKSLIPKVEKTTSGNLISPILQSSYYGQGTYERTSETATPILQNQNMLFKQQERNKVTLSQLQVLRNLEREKLQSGQSLYFRQPEALQPKQESKIIPSLKPIEKVLSILRTNQKQQPRTRQQTKQEYQTPQQPTPNKKIIPFWKKPSMKIPSKATSLSKKIYSAFTKRFGKWQKISSGEDFSEVLGAGKKNVLSTLGRSLKVFEEGKAIRLSGNEVFRPSKRDSFTIVQRSKYALSSPSEVKEIQFFKKSKKKRRFF